MLVPKSIYFRFILWYHKPLWIYLLASECTFIYRTLTEYTFCLPYIDQTTFWFTLLCHTPLLIYLLGSQSTFTYLTLNKPTFIYLISTKPVVCAHTYHIPLLAYLRVYHLYYLCTHLQHCLFLLYLTLGNPISLYPRVSRPFILVDNLHLLYTSTHNHHGKYQLKEPQRCCWTNPSK